MPRHCSAAGCKSRDTRESRKAGITFHRLPKRGTSRRTLWIINSRRKGPEGQGQWDPQSDFIYFCSKHFTPESFELSGVSGYRRLKDDAVPTIFQTQPNQRGRCTKKSSRGRGKQADVSRQTRTKVCPAKDEPKDQKILKADADAANGDRGEVTDFKTACDKEGNMQAPAQASAEAAQTSDVLHQSSGDLPPESSSAPSSPRPPSPSCYMRRLPPPPGFYLSKEHNYAQLCPLVWRKRYDKAIDNLEKALRLLSAARRRENRLRHALLRLRESRLKSTLSRVWDGTRGKEGRGGRGRLSTWTNQRGDAAKVVRVGLEESEMEGVTEDLELLTEEAGGWRGQAHAAKEEEGCCFYCGRGREDDGSKDLGSPRISEIQRPLVGLRQKSEQENKRGRGRVSKMGKCQSVEGTGIAGEQKECYFYYCQPAENEENLQVVTMEIPHHQPDKEGKSTLGLQDNTQQQYTMLHTPAKVHLQMRGLSGPPAALQDTTALIQPPQLQILQSSLKSGLLLTDLTSRERGMTEGLPEEDQQVYWVQKGAEGHLLWLPVPTDDGAKGEAGCESINKDAITETILVSKVEFQEESMEEGAGICVEGEGTGLRTAGMTVRRGGLLSNSRSTVVGGDVRERLKEHLEGFQLELSNEYSD